MVVYLLVLFVGATFSLLLTPLAAGIGLRVGIVDYPGVRKIHIVATPRVGGASIAVALTLTLILTFTAGHYLPGLAIPDPAQLVPILIGAAMVFAIGLWDDVAGLSPLSKVAGQLAAAGVAIGSGALLIDQVTFFGTVHQLGWLAVPATFLWIVGITNAFNLVDGVDGLAGGLACIAASTCAAVLIARGDQAEALLLIAFVGAVIGFLPYNLNPAEVFLGDSGSLLCGFLLAVTAIAGQQKGATALAVGVPLLIFALPILDTLLSIARRLIGGQKDSMTLGQRIRALSRILMADQAHIHHRLIGLGLSHRRTVLMLYALALACSVLALISIQVPPR
jgi:UDP-GlcNAc:undecaprenyl-phosphate GlcNAc-1-phosphate transferase